MIARGVVLATSLAATAVSSFTLGVLLSRRDQTVWRAEYAAELQQIRNEIARRDELTATSGETPAAAREDVEARRAERAQMVAEIKEQLQQEMGLLPVRLLRDRRSSFVELYADDNLGKTNYGTAGYLGHGYFITVKHAVVPLKDEQGRQPARRMVSIRIIYKGKEVPARVVDAGDAKVEVDKGDWAVIKTRDLDLPPLPVDTTFPYEFAEPIFRLGNDYSKGIVVSTGYVGQKTPNGLVTALTDGHPGVSGGGVLDRRGYLVGIPIGRMQGDYRFSFILPLRREMLRKVPASPNTENVLVATNIQ